MRKGFVQILLILIVLIILIIFAVPYPQYIPKTQCKPCADINNCPSCLSEQWIWEKPLFWSVILPIFNQTRAGSAVPVTQVSPTSTPADEIAGWKRYRSQEYSFEIKYPP